jgi:hypothetical protein
MRIHRGRLLALLEQHGFSYGPESRATDALIFVRPGHRDELFESIIVDSQGKRGEAVYASVGVAVTSQVAYKVLGEVQLLGELGQDPNRGWTIIEDDRKAIEWERQLSTIGPTRAKEWADIAGPKVLRQTEDTRIAVGKYLALVKPTEDPEWLIARMEQAASKSIAHEAERIHACPILNGGPDQQAAYRVACYVIVAYSEEVEKRSFRGTDPMNDTNLMYRVIMLADKFLNASSRRKTVR